MGTNVAHLLRGSPPQTGSMVRTTAAAACGEFDAVVVILRVQACHTDVIAVVMTVTISGKWNVPLYMVNKERAEAPLHTYCAR
jgi:hypothetical protein